MGPGWFLALAEHRDQGTSVGAPARPLHQTLLSREVTERFFNPLAIIVNADRRCSYQHPDAPEREALTQNMALWPVGQAILSPVGMGVPPAKLHEKPDTRAALGFAVFSPSGSSFVSNGLEWFFDPAIGTAGRKQFCTRASTLPA